MDFGWQELLIVLVIVVIIFGGSKLAGVGKASGRAIREFRDEMKGPDGEQPASQAQAGDAAPNGAPVQLTPEQMQQFQQFQQLQQLQQQQMQQIPPAQASAPYAAYDPNAAQFQTPQQPDGR